MSFKDKLKKIKDQQKDEVDWEARKNDWIRNVDGLYVVLRGFLGEYLDAGDIQFSSEMFPLEEEMLGQYVSWQLKIRFGKDIIVNVDPVGSVIIGGIGRCDMYLEGNQKNRYLLILFPGDDGEEPHWKITHITDKKQYRDLTKESLEESLDRLLDV